MKQESHILRFGILAFAGILLFCAAVSDISTVPTSEACNSTPDCMGWTVRRTGCEWFCNCGQQQMPYTCYTEEGTCNANGATVLFRRCYLGNCCCPSGNCAGQGGGGGGGGGGSKAATAGLKGTVTPAKNVATGHASNPLVSVVFSLSRSRRGETGLGL